MLSSVLLALESPSPLHFSKSAGASVLTCGGGSCRAFLAGDPVSMCPLSPIQWQLRSCYAPMCGISPTPTRKQERPL
jgi:hypothetical protein